MSVVKSALMVVDKLEKKQDAEAKKKLKELNRIIKVMNAPADTGIIERAKKRMSKEDQRIFDMLPISEKEKEQLLIELYTKQEVKKTHI